MPYLHWATSGKDFDERTDLIKELAEAFEDRNYRRKSAKEIEILEPEPEGQQFSKLKKRMMRAFLHPDKVTDPNKKDRYLHIRRTLDQFYYSTLPDADARTQDQVVYKFAMKQHEKKEKHDLNGQEQNKNEMMNGNYALDYSEKSKKSSEKELHTDSSGDNHIDDISWVPPKVLMVNQLWMWVLNGHSGGESQKAICPR